mmetsp:Transcript_29959/g.79902  ORF Transcript_29959/g.79902 Transcript_29959/m.79902 type:complete len:274 (+) Transcript_29959:698-1519(+)
MLLLLPLEFLQQLLTLLHISGEAGPQMRKVLRPIRRQLRDPVLLGLLHNLQPHLRQAHGAPKLVVVLFAVHKLVHDVRHLTEASDLANLLETLLRGEAVLGMLEEDRLQIVADEFLHCPHLEVAIEGRLVRLRRRVKRHRVTPLVEFPLVPDAPPLLLQGLIEVAQRVHAPVPFLVHVMLKLPEMTRDIRPPLAHTATLPLALLEVARLALQMILQLLDLLTCHGGLMLQTRDHMLVDDAVDRGLLNRSRQGIHLAFIREPMRGRPRALVLGK